MVHEDAEKLRTELKRETDRAETAIESLNEARDEIARLKAELRRLVPGYLDCCLNGRTAVNETTINLRARPSTVSLIDRAADIQCKTRSAFIRDCAEAAARAVFKTPVALGERCPLCGTICD